MPFAVGETTMEVAVMVFPTANAEEAKRARKRREKRLKVKLDRDMVADCWYLLVDEEES